MTSGTSSSMTVLGAVGAGLSTSAKAASLRNLATGRWTPQVELIGFGPACRRVFLQADFGRSRDDQRLDRVGTRSPEYWMLRVGIWRRKGPTSPTPLLQGLLRGERLQRAQHRGAVVARSRARLDRWKALRQEVRQRAREAVSRAVRPAALARPRRRRKPLPSVRRVH